MEHNILKLQKQLKQLEHETAQQLFNQLLRAGVDYARAISLIYRAGVVEGIGEGIKKQKYAQLEHERRLEAVATVTADTAFIDEIALPETPTEEGAGDE